MRFPVVPSPLPVFLSRAAFVLLTPLVLIALWLGFWSFSYWLYAMPLLAFVLFPGRVAALLIAGISILALTIIQWQLLLPERHQLMVTYILSCLLSLVLAVLREYKRRQSLPLRDPDQLNQPASQHFLCADLHKEIQRSEREGSNLSVVQLGLTLPEGASSGQLQTRLPDIGRFLLSHLRAFDACYRIDDRHFLMILPGMSSQDASRTLQHLVESLHRWLDAERFQPDVHFGVASLNAGDDPQSLQANAAAALRRAEQQADTARNPASKGADA